MSLLPWQSTQWRILQESMAQGRLPHALLLCGPEGVGKGYFARQLAQAKLCTAPGDQGQACGACRSCQLFLAGSHPDYSSLGPAEEKKNIAVDQVRELGRYLALTPQYGSGKAVIIEPAETMNVNAANSLLKTLEEPPAGVLLILVSDRPAQLMATIRSRCQIIRFGGADHASAATWLQGQLASTDRAELELILAMADGAPFRALAYARDGALASRAGYLEELEQLARPQGDPVSCAQQWLSRGATGGLYWLESWLLDMLRLKTVAEPPRVANRDLQPRLKALAERLTPRQLIGLSDEVAASRQALERNLNPQLMLENVLMQWCSCFSVSR